MDNSMADLPSLVLKIIFQYLNLREQFRCGQVCRRFRFIVTNQPKEKLFLHFGPYPMDKRWSFTNELIKYQNSMRIESINFLRHQLTRIHFENLKKLIIFNLNYNSKAILIESLHRFNLNYFKELEILELNGMELSQKTSLNLRNLKSLTLKNFYITKLLELNCPNLKVFVCFCDLSKILFKFPESIETMQFFNNGNDCKLNLKFDNLEQLNVYDINGDFSPSFLSKVPKLKKFIIYSQISEQAFKLLKRQRKIYNLIDLKVLHFGFESELGFRKCNFALHYFFNNMLHESTLNEVVINYTKLNRDSPWPILVHYTELINAFKTIPDDFFFKFVNFYKIRISNLNLADDQRQQSDVMNFLKKCGFLEFLNFENCLISQEFLDQLHHSTSMITLELTNSTNLNKFNFNFLSKLNATSIGIVDSLLPDVLIHCAFESIDFKYLYFKQEYHVRFEISKEKSEFLLSISDQKADMKFDQLSNLVRYLRSHKSMKIYLD